MDRRNLAFDRTNFILLAIGFVVVVIGFILMSGPSSTEEAFNPDIFSARRIKVAPVVCFVGFVSMIYAIIRKPKDVASDQQDEKLVETNTENAENKSIEVSSKEE